ncbi:hypothetical protein [Marinibacterium sp. SX1]|uniref:hypothetical protein n=1 Tax=Marinibacterium sp. SX1 TaxID=3388424 RepID=UPI003D17AC9F
MGKRPVPTPEKLNEAYQEALRRFADRQNLTAIDIGRVWKAGRPVDEAAIRLHVTRKQPETELDAAAVFPREILGIPVDVVEGVYRIPEAARMSDSRRRGRFPFLMGGMSCSRLDGEVGTVGVIVKDRRTGRAGLLSNWHVLAGPRANPGDPILHPGRIDGGQPAQDEIARLDRWMLDTDGDAAVAFLTGALPWVPLQLGSFTEIAGTRTARLGEVLSKSGRTTGVTTAVVDGIGMYRVNYEVRPGEIEHRDIRGFKLVSLLEGNPHDEELSAAGDSGACWVDSSQNAVGLHFAGETAPGPDQEHAIACDMGTVMDRLDLEPAGFDDLASQRADTRSWAEMSDPRLDGSDPLPVWGGPFPWPAHTPGPMPASFPAPWSGSWGQGWSDPSPISDPRDAPDRSPQRPNSGPTRPPEVRRPDVADIVEVWSRLDKALDKAGLIDPGRRFTSAVTTLLNAGDDHACLRSVINEPGTFPDIRDVTTSELRMFRSFDQVCEFLARLKKVDA